MPDGHLLSPASRPASAGLSPARIAALLATAYALLGLVAVVALARLTPPFQNPDELAHVLRAEQVGEGGLIGTRFRQGERLVAGGKLDPGAEALYRVFEPLIFQPGNQATRAMFDRAAPLGWDGAARWQYFANTAIYPPVLYLPAAAALDVGHVAGLSVTRTLHLARLAGGGTAVAVGALALALSGGAAPLLFALLALPMSLSLMASVSQDALLLPVAALAGALLLRSREGGGWWLAGACACLVLVGTARPAYLPIAALPLLGPALRLGPRLGGAAVAAAAILGWSALAAAVALVNLSDGGLADPATQLARLEADPALVLHVALGTLHTHGERLLESFLGRLGWLDLPLPAWLRGLALAGLALAALTSCAPRAGRGTRWLGLGVALSAAGAVFALQYLVWTPVGAGMVEGVQGRYFLPLALLLVVCLPARPVLPRHASLLLPVLGAVTLGGTLWEVVGRYYLR